MSFNGPTDSDKATATMQGPHFNLNLLLDFEPGAPRQPWSMVRSPGNSLTKGLGNPKEIADTVCSIVKERGAKLLN